MGERVGVEAAERPVSKADANLTRCTTCNAHLGLAAVYHPYSYCVLVKAGLDPEQVVCSAVRYYQKNGWPE